MLIKKCWVFRNSAAENEFTYEEVDGIEYMNYPLVFMYLF